MITPLLDGALDGRWVLYTLFRKMMLESVFAHSLGDDVSYLMQQ